MASKDISQLDPVASAAVIVDATVLEIQIVGGTAPESRKATRPQLADALARRTGQVRVHRERPKVGTTAGWVVGAADDLSKMGTVPASQTNSTLVVPLTGFKIGETITAWSLSGSLQSAGGNCTVTADLRVLTAAAAGATDASVGAMAAPLTVTANTVLSAANAGKTGLTRVVAVGEAFYLLVTATTAVGCTQELLGVPVTTTEV